jgi:hypothetical protein
MSVVFRVYYKEGVVKYGHVKINENKICDIVGLLRKILVDDEIEFKGKFEEERNTETDRIYLKYASEEEYIIYSGSNNDGDMLVITIEEALSVFMV